MARYRNPIKQELVNMYSPINVGYYKDILDTAQGNLNQATMMGAKFMEDAYGNKYIDPKARDLYIGKAQEMIAQGLNEDFQTPARMASTVLKASQALAPWKNLNEVQLAEAKREQELRDRWGSNYIGNTIANQSLIDPATGQLISPDKIKLIAGNREDLQQAFMKDYAGRANMVRSVDSALYPILGGQYYESKTTKIKGITEDEWRQEFANNPELAKQYMQQMPELARAIQASGVNPEEYLAKELSTISQQLIGGTETDRRQLANRNFIDAANRQPQGEAVYDKYQPLPYQETTDVKGVDRKFNLKEIGQVRGIINLDKNPKGTFTDLVTTMPVLNEMSKKYPDLYNRATSASGTWKEKANKFLDLVAQTEFGKMESNAKVGATYKSNRWYINDPLTNNGIQTAMLVGDPTLEVKDAKGNKSTLGELSKENALPTFKDNGDIVLSTSKGNYTWNTSDEEVLNTLNVPSRNIVKLQKKLSEQRWAAVPDPNPQPTPIVSPVKGNANIIGGVAFITIPSKSKNANKIRKVWYSGINDDGSLDLFYEGTPENYVYEDVDFDEVTKINAMSLGKINRVETNPSTK